MSTSDGYGHRREGTTSSTEPHCTGDTAGQIALHILPDHWGQLSLAITSCDIPACHVESSVCTAEPDAAAVNRGRCGYRTCLTALQSVWWLHLRTLCYGIYIASCTQTWHHLTHSLTPSTSNRHRSWIASCSLLRLPAVVSHLLFFFPFFFLLVYLYREGKNVYIYFSKNVC